MKFFIPLALLAVTAVTAQDPDCEANYIVETCLESETKKLEACKALQYDCMCAASEAIVTCFNNCPNDTRGAAYRSQLTINCQNASLYGTTTRQTATATGSITTTAASAEATTTDADASETPTASDGQAPSGTFVQNADGTDEPNVGVAQLARNTGGLLLAVAGVVAAVL